MQSAYYFKGHPRGPEAKVCQLTVGCAGPLSCHARGPLPWTSDAPNQQELKTALLQH